MRQIYVVFFCDLRSDLRIRLATLRKFIRKFWFCKIVLTCVDLRVRLARDLVNLALYIDDNDNKMTFFGTHCLCALLVVSSWLRSDLKWHYAGANKQMSLQKSCYSLIYTTILYCKYCLEVEQID